MQAAREVRDRVDRVRMDQGRSQRDRVERDAPRRLEPEAIRLGPVGRTVRRCLVCGSREVHTDAVEQRGWVLLAECPHCDHRWTQPLPEPAPAPASRGVLRVAPGVRCAPEVVSAA